MNMCNRRHLFAILIQALSEIIGIKTYAYFIAITMYYAHPFEFFKNQIKKKLSAK